VLGRRYCALVEDDVRLTFEELSDGVVRLRPWLAVDAPDVENLLIDPEITRWTSIPPVLDEDVLERVCQPSWAAIIDASTSELQGGVGIYRLDRRHSKAELGYWLGSPARGKGSATRALRLLSGWTFQELGVARLETAIVVGNTASIRVAERAGFVREGIMRSERELQGRRRDMILMSLLPR
jgi:RimJ/RimL family protein N-acetyltransferase